MAEKREWKIDNYSDKSERISNDTIKYFQRSNDWSEKRNLKSKEKIAKLEIEKDRMLSDFFEKYQISYDEAKEIENQSWHSERDFNLVDLKKIDKIIDLINGERFFVSQRKKMIQKNNEIIDDILNWHKRAIAREN